MFSISSVLFGLLLFIFVLSFLLATGKMRVVQTQITKSLNDISGLRLITLLGITVVFALYQILFMQIPNEVMGADMFGASLLSFGPRFYDLCPVQLGCYHPPIFIAVEALFSITSSFLGPIYRYKAVIVIPNLVLGYFIFRQVGGNRGLLAASLLLSNLGYIFFTVYMTSPDPLAFLIVFLAIFAFESKQTSIGSVLLGVAFLTRQYTAFVAFPLLVLAYSRNGIRSFIKSLMIVLTTCLLISLPFLVFGSPENYLRLILLSGPSQKLGVWGTSQFSPAFSGLWTLVAWAEQLFSFTVPNAQILVFIGLIFSFLLISYIILSKHVQDFWFAALLGMAVFVLSTPNNDPHMTMMIVPAGILIGSKCQLKKVVWLGIVLAPVLYRIAQYFTQFTGLSAPFVLGDIVMVVVCLAVIASYSRKTNMMAVHTM